MEEQKGDEEIVGFSYLNIQKIRSSQQKSCSLHIPTQTVHDILKTVLIEVQLFFRVELMARPRYVQIEIKLIVLQKETAISLFVEPEGFNK